MATQNPEQPGATQAHPWLEETYMKRQKSEQATRTRTFPWRSIVGGLLVTLFIGVMARDFILDGFLSQERDKAVHKDVSKVENPVSGEVPNYTELIYRTKDGERVRVPVESAKLADFVQEQLSQFRKDQKALLGRVEDSVRDETAEIFGAMNERVERFGDWYFGWDTSFYFTSQAILSTAEHAVKFRNIRDGVSYDLEQILLTKFEKLVLRPEIVQFRLERAYQQARAEIHAAYLANLAKLDSEFRTFVARQTEQLTAPMEHRNPDLKLDWHSQAQKVSKAGFERGLNEVTSGASLVVGLGILGKKVGSYPIEKEPTSKNPEKAKAQSAKKLGARKGGRKIASKGGQRILLRAFAPLVSRTTTMAASASASGSVGASVGGPVGAGIGIVSGLVLDYLINEAREALERDEFETRIREALRAHREEWQAMMTNNLRTAVRTWNADTMQLLVQYDNQSR